MYWLVIIFSFYFISIQEFIFKVSNNSVIYSSFSRSLASPFIVCLSLCEKTRQAALVFRWNLYWILTVQGSISLFVMLQLFYRS